MKVGRLCVHRDYARRGIGTLTTDFALKKLIAMNEDIGVCCSFVIVDAKKEAIHFYKKKKMGFEILKGKCRCRSYRLCHICHIILMGEWIKIGV